MRYIADFHLHSKFSRATSRDMDLAHISKSAKIKGIDIIGTGDFTHPLWLAEIKKNLEEDGSGLLTSKNPPAGGLKFIITGEISSIYTQGGKVRKIHTIIFVPDIKTANNINEKLTGMGNLYSDGRPILGLSAKDLAKLILTINPKSLIIPAHAWTPWFSIFGSNSGFDSIEECFEDLTSNIYSIETGLSSDPEMNWRLSALDKITLISNSDAHSPANLGREANVFELEENELNYKTITDIIKKKDSKKFPYTIEFFPEEGKYHFDGHRNCNVIVNPFEKKYPNNLCPSCGKKLTIGVMNRVDELADRSAGFHNVNFPASRHLIPLAEIIAESLGVQKGSKRTQEEYLRMVNHFGSEFSLLLDTPTDKIAQINPKLAQGIERMRQGEIETEAGYDGVFGKIKVFGKDKEAAPAQTSLF